MLYLQKVYGVALRYNCLCRTCLVDYFVMPQKFIVLMYRIKEKEIPYTLIYSFLVTLFLIKT